MSQSFFSLKSLQVLFRLCLLLTFVFSSSYSQATAPSIKNHLEFLNSAKSVYAYVEPLKAQFKTDEDHRQIDKMAKSLAKQTKKWLWRFEQQGKDSIGFRVNGKIQYVMEQVNLEENSFVVKGEKIQVKNGESFLSFKSKLENALSKKSVSFNQLFIGEAQAFIPLLGLAAFGFMASMAHASQRTYDPNADFKWGRPSCAPASHERRVKEVKKNNFRFSETVGSYPFDGHCPASYSQYSRPIGICKCIYRKQQDCFSGGFAMTKAGATRLCLDALAGQSPKPTYKKPDYQPIPTKDYKNPGAGNYNPIPTKDYKNPGAGNYNPIPAYDNKSPYSYPAGNAEGGGGNNDRRD